MLAIGIQTVREVGVGEEREIAVVHVGALAVGVGVLAAQTRHSAPASVPHRGNSIEGADILRV